MPGSVSKVEMATSMTLTYKVLFPSISMFATLPSLSPYLSQKAMKRGSV
jgi:hypothetical protein